MKGFSTVVDLIIITICLLRQAAASHTYADNKNTQKQITACTKTHTTHTEQYSNKS